MPDLLDKESLQFVFNSEGYQIILHQIDSLRRLKLDTTIRACNPISGSSPIFAAGELNGIDLVLSLIRNLERDNGTSSG